MSSKKYIFPISSIIVIASIISFVFLPQPESRFLAILEMMQEPDVKFTNSNRADEIRDSIKKLQFDKRAKNDPLLEFTSKVFESKIRIQTTRQDSYKDSLFFGKWTGHREPQIRGFAWIHLLRSHLSTRRDSAAIKTAESALLESDLEKYFETEINYLSGRAFYLAGDEALRVNRRSDSERYFQTAKDLINLAITSQEEPRFYKHLGDIYSAEEDWTSAVNCYSRALSRHEKDSLNGGSLASSSIHKLNLARGILRHAYSDRNRNSVKSVQMLEVTAKLLTAILRDDQNNFEAFWEQSRVFRLQNEVNSSLSSLSRAEEVIRGKELGDYFEKKALTLTWWLKAITISQSTEPISISDILQSDRTDEEKKFLSELFSSDISKYKIEDSLFLFNDYSGRRKELKVLQNSNSISDILRTR